MLRLGFGHVEVSRGCVVFGAHAACERLIKVCFRDMVLHKRSGQQPSACLTMFASLQKRRDKVAHSCFAPFLCKSALPDAI